LESLLKEPSQIEGGHASVPVIQRQHTNILHTLESYALLTQRCADSAKLAKLIASYQKFLFGALCHVACCVGIDERVVNKMMGSISNGNPEHLRQIRLAAAWGVAAVDRLQCKSKWGMRSGDILFYCLFAFFYPFSLAYIELTMESSHSVILFIEKHGQREAVDKRLHDLSGSKSIYRDECSSTETSHEQSLCALYNQVHIWENCSVCAQSPKVLPFTNTCLLDFLRYANLCALILTPPGIYLPGGIWNHLARMLLMIKSSQAFCPL
jgi:hypothetical protein